MKAAHPHVHAWTLERLNLLNRRLLALANAGFDLRIAFTGVG